MSRVSPAPAGPSADLFTCQPDLAPVAAPAVPLEMAVCVTGGSNGGRKWEDRKEISSTFRLVILDS